ncbi:gamma-glutamyltransferase family protein [Sphingomicrobium astaxanthinifaciens]|uniref:gamma-glutamyltransferase family protein n=1 Tax=Sphingomicrobium astaxanthinifaciens TaxID=1227949 RepID=UPI001FCC63B4|nr:gamma-glutamyltransferase family protein [Sphingomicrobium astaxanthinifaciens]MCJ7421327.1 gamma-glutamyltransferase family protein [Sphingomicrobium astaxanthinifaciens]
MTRLFPLLLALLLAACATPQAALGPDDRATHRPFVIAANPLAAEAGMDILERGGSAADAAVAVQAMLSLVEPQSSGVGGGAFLHFYDADTSTSRVYDGREVAPAGASRTMFLDADGNRLSYRAAVLSGRAVGVPGAIAALHAAHADHGRLGWDRLFTKAIVTAEEGFIISPRLGNFLAMDFPQLSQPDAVRYFGDKTTGDRLRNLAYGDFLRRLRLEGPAALVAGPTAERIVAKTREGELPGTLTLADLAAYEVIERDPVCTDWLRFSVCAPPPPSSGAAFLQLLGLLERTAIAETSADDPEGWYLFAMASRLMYADRDAYFGDVPDVPIAGLLAPDYLDARARLIAPTAGPAPEAGRPEGARRPVPDRTMEPTGTSHFIVRDRYGDAISITTTVESIFGTGRMVDGFFLNNQLTDFSFDPLSADGEAHPNAVAPGKRPRSSMIPLILLDDGEFAGAIGSAGGNSIPAYVGKTLVGATYWGLSMEEALALPNLIARGETIGAEVDKLPAGVVAGLAARGVALAPGQGEGSGVHGVIIRTDGRIDGGADPRREGVVLIGE